MRLYLPRFLCFGSSSGFELAVSAALTDNGQSQLDELQRQIDEYDKQLSSMNSELSGLLERKNQIDEEIEIISQKMVKTNELLLSMTMKLQMLI